MAKGFPLLFLLILGLLRPLPAGEPRHGISLYGPQDLKYKPGQCYEHANPQAPKGGTLKLFILGSFTKLNPYSLKGRVAPGLGLGLGLVFENLVDDSSDGDEHFSQYGLIAEKIAVAADRLAITYYLNPKARFSDGKPLTADDVIFSFNLIKHPEYHPFYKAYYADVEKAEKLDRHTVRFTFKKYNQELPLIMGQLAILPKHVYGVEGKDFGKDFDDLAVGSGPYVVESFERGKHMTLKRNPDYWGKDLPVNRGRYNFDRIIYKVFLSAIPARESLKGGQTDANQISSSKDWAREYSGAFVKMNYIKKRTFAHNRVAGMQCYVFNLRKPLFKDIKVRKAIAAAFDFEYMNQNLFYSQYTRQLCFFDNNKKMYSRGPAAGEVRRILLELRKKYNQPAAKKYYVPKHAITRGPYNIGDLPGGGRLSIHDKITLANIFLDKEGWIYDREAGARKKGRQLLKFEILISNAGWERIVNPFIERLREIGVKASYRLVQPAEFVKKVKDFKFDMIVAVFGQGSSPGNEQRNMWLSKAADITGSRNVVGMKNPAIDEAVGKIVAASDRKTLVTYVQVLDRILCANHYVIPHWYIAYDRAIYWNRISGPKKYAAKSAFLDNVINWWWYDQDKARRLAAAKQAGEPFAE